MDELRSEIRAAFEKEQAAHPPAAGLRRNVVESVSARRRPTRNFQWVAAIAAVLFAALIIAGLMSTRFHPRATVPATTPHASPVADYGPPPAGVPLLYVKDPVHTTWLIGFDWSGAPRATLKLDPAIGSVGMAPDGQSFAVGFGAKGGTGEILDRLGQPVLGVGGGLPGSSLPIWADDFQHTCGVAFDSQGFNATLVTLTPGQAVKSVAVLGSNQGQPGSYRIASCSFRNDTALVVRSAQAPVELLSVRLSTGKVTSLYTYATPELLSNVVASPDSTLIAENSSKSIGQLQGQNAPTTVIRRVSDRAILVKMDPSFGVLAYNNDDSLALLTTTPWVGGMPTALQIWDLRSGQPIWTYNGPGMFGNAVAQPGGQDFAIYVRKPNVVDPLTDLMIVRADGTATSFPRRYEPAW